MPLGIHWIPSHRGSIGSRTDKQIFEAWRPPFVKIVTVDNSVPYLEDVPASAKIIVRNHPMSELGGERGLRRTQPRLIVGDLEPEEVGRAYETYFREFRSLTDTAKRALRSPLTRTASDARTAGLKHAAQCSDMAAYCATKGVTQDRLLFEGLNEPMLWSVEPPDKVAVYYKAFLEGLHQAGLRGVVGNFGVGWPGNGGKADAPVEWGFWKPVIDIMLPGDYLGLHEYWDLNGVTNEMNGQANMWRWWAGRYEQCPYNVPILMTECGIDTGVSGRFYGSWGNLPGTMDEKARRYVGELAWYWNKCRADGRIQALFPFSYDRGHDTWIHFDIRSEAFINEYERRLAEFPDARPLPVVVKPPTPPAPTPPSGPTDAYVSAAVQGAAWRKLGVPLNTASAFYKHAAANNLGRPVSEEFDEIIDKVVYRIQLFDNAIVYAKVGEWDKVKHRAYT